MTPRLELDDLINIMLENTCSDFRKTEQYRLLSEKHNQIEEEYTSNLSDNEKETMEEYIEAFMELQSAENEFVYRQGFKDCVLILKKLTILI